MAIKRTEYVTVDLAAPEIKTVRVHQYDVNSVALYVSCTDHGTPVVLDPSIDVYFKGLKPDGTKIYTKHTIEDGIIVITFVEQLFLVDGTVQAEVQLVQNDVILHSMPFKIIVVKGTFANDADISEDDMSAINEMIATYQEAITRAEDAVSLVEDYIGSFTPISNSFIDSLFNN